MVTYLASNRASAGISVLYGIAASIAAVLTLVPIPALQALDRFEADLPHIDAEDFLLRQSIRITDRDGQEIFRTYNDEDRVYLKLEDIPPVVRNAFIAIEDERFYERPCIDARAILRAAYKTYIKKDREGGSTITQQLVRSITGERDITLKRKLREIVLACELEQSIGKDAILEQYLNRINFGGTLYGVQSASNAFFGLPAWHLDAARAAILASIVQKPSFYAPGGRIAEIPDRTYDVLSSMKRLGFITNEDSRFALAILPMVTFNVPDPDDHPPFPFIALILKRSTDVLEKENYSDALTYSGVVITTTLDSTVQHRTDEAIRNVFPDIAAWTGARDVAAVVMDRKSREIVGYVGNIDWGGNTDSQWVDMAAAPRQLGSAFKPIVYTSYMENGHTADTITSDWPMTINGLKPKNFEGGFLGRMTIRKALGWSRNIPAIRAFLEVGEERVLRLASSMGAPTPLLVRDKKRLSNPRFSYGWPMAIGAAEMPLYELVQAYGAIAEGGVTAATRTIQGITSFDGTSLYTPPESPRIQIVKPSSANMVSDILSDWDARPERWNSVVDVPRDWKIALKTGTSNVCRARKYDGNCKSYGVLNTVAVGFTDKYVIGVLVANANNDQLHSQADGLNAAVPVWTAIVRSLAGSQ